MTRHPATRPSANRAREVLARFGVDMEEAHRSGTSASNEVWLAERIVLRISQGPGSTLRREAALASILPADVGYPEVLGHGVDDGREWMVTSRLPGRNLEEAWPDLDAGGRVDAVTDLWRRLRAIHRTDVERARALGCTATPFYALAEADAARLMGWLTDQGMVDEVLGRRLREMLEEMFRAMRLVPPALAHTDAGPHNSVWSGSHAVPVDFEFACVAPADLDLENVLRCLSFQSGPDPSAQLADLAADLLSRPGARTRLWGYAVLRDLWGLRLWLRNARTTNDVERWGGDPDDYRTWGPWLHLRRHANRTSWLADL